MTKFLIYFLVVVLTIFCYGITKPHDEFRQKKFQQRYIKIIRFFEEDFLDYVLEESEKEVRINVLVSAYTSSKYETDSTPFIAAWNNRLDPKNDFKKSIAISRDLLKSGLKNKSEMFLLLPNNELIKVVVKDKMNKRFKKRIDLYFGTNRKLALDFGIKEGKLIF